MVIEFGLGALSEGSCKPLLMASAISMG